MAGGTICGPALLPERAALATAAPEGAGRFRGTLLAALAGTAGLALLAVRVEFAGAAGFGGFGDAAADTAALTGATRAEGAGAGSDAAALARLGAVAPTRSKST